MAEPELNSLARSVMKKTHGNPFFVLQLLRSMYDLGLFSFDLASNRWKWVSALCLCLCLWSFHSLTDLVLFALIRTRCGRPRLRCRAMWCS